MIREINPLEYFDKISDMLADHWGEVGFDFELDLNRDLYQALYEADLLITLGAFDGDELIGYASAFIGPHLMSRKVVQCEVNAVFVKPEHRGAISGQIIREINRFALARGANRISWLLHPDCEFASALLSRGQKVTEQSISGWLQ